MAKLTPTQKFQADLLNRLDALVEVLGRLAVPANTAPPTPEPAPYPADQPPPLPHAFWGAVAAETAGEIEVRGLGVVGVAGQNPFAFAAGKFGGPGAFDPKLIVQGRSVDGTPLAFYVNGQRARVNAGNGTQDTWPFQAGGVTQIVLTLP